MDSGKESLVDSSQTDGLAYVTEWAIIQLLAPQLEPAHLGILEI